MTALRLLLGTSGVAVAGYGGWRLLDTQATDQVVLVAAWLAVGVLVHDVVLSPVVLALGRLGRAVPRAVAAGGVVVLVVLGPVALAAVPVLGRFGADPTNPTLLDRDYARGLLAVAAAVLVAAAVVAATGLRSRAGGRSSGGQSPGRR